jgi:hypothetical protein
MASLDAFLNDHVKNIVFVRSALMGSGDAAGSPGVVEAVPESTPSLPLAHSSTDYMAILRTKYNALAQQFGVLLLVVSTYSLYTV